MICTVCPHRCDLSEGEIGKCLIRQNLNGTIVNKLDGYLSLVTVEPIEKRPFFHFMPGTKFLSCGSYGCNFSCAFCQNFTVSQTDNGVKKYFDQDKLINLALEKSVAGIAFTYNEPTIYYDYITKIGHVKPPELKMAIKTNGFAESWVWNELNCVDAFNVDIKGDDFEYQKVCGGSLEPVLNSIEHLVSLKKHIEISYLVLPRKVNDWLFHTRIRDFLFKLSSNIPVHLLYFYPFHEMTAESYKDELMFGIHDFFAEKMKYVYISNLYSSKFQKYRNTYCPECKNLMVNREKRTIILKKICCRMSV